MSVGKSAAQASHAACEAYRISDPKMVEAWMFGNHYIKLVMAAEDEIQLDSFERYIRDRGFKTALIIDEGRTEIKPFSKTALGVEIVDKSDPHVQATFGEFRLYPPEPTGPQTVDLVDAYNTVGAHDHLNRRGRQYRDELLGQ